MRCRLKDPPSLGFADLDASRRFGVYPDYAAAEDAWRSSAQHTVAAAEMKYVSFHLHRLLQPDQSEA